MREFRLLSLGCPPDEAPLRRARERLSRFFDARVDPVLARSGLEHEHGSPHERAGRLMRALESGAIAGLANGAGAPASCAGDPLLGQILPFLPRRIEGTILGAISHGHVLTALSRSHPGLDARIGPPIVEVIGAADRAPAEEAARALADLVNRGPLPARFAHEELRVIRPGSAVGPIAAGNLMALAMQARDLGWPDRPILFVEAAEIRVITFDRLLQRLRLAGRLTSLGALLVGVPVSPVDSALPWVECLRRAVDGTDYPVAFGAFVGSGWPCPRLRLGAEATITLSSSALEIEWTDRASGRR